MKIRRNEFTLVLGTVAVLAAVLSLILANRLLAIIVILVGLTLLGFSIRDSRRLRRQLRGPVIHCPMCGTAIGISLGPLAMMEHVRRVHRADVELTGPDETGVPTVVIRASLDEEPEPVTQWTEDDL